MGPSVDYLEDVVDVVHSAELVSTGTCLKMAADKLWG